MSRIICKKHGRQGVIELCYHLSDAIKQSTKLIYHINFEGINISYEDLDPELNNLEDCSVHLFCNQCINKYNLPLDKPISSVDRDGIYKKAFNKMAIICVKCLKENISKWEDSPL